MTRLRRIALLAVLFVARTASADCPAGPFVAGDTIRCTFNTQTSTFVTLGGTPVVSVYKDSSLTQTTTGVTLSVDFDGVTGLQHVAVDTSADATFFAAGHDFQIIVTTGTVGGVSVAGASVGAFSLGRALTEAQIQSGLATSTALATVQSDTDDIQTRLPATLTADGNIKADTLRVSGTTQTARDLGASVLLSSGTGTGQVLLSSGLVEQTQASADKAWGTASRTLTACSFCISAGAVWDEALSSHTTAGTAGKALSDASSGGSFPTAAQIANEIYNGTTYGPSTWTVTGSGGAYFLAQLGRLSSTAITLASIVTSDDVLHVVPGTAYTGVRQPKVPFTIDNTWDLTSATPKLVILDGDTALLSVTGTVTAPGTTAQLVQFSLTAAQTALLTRVGAAAYTYQVSATWAADLTALPVVMVQSSVDTTTKYF